MNQAPNNLFQAEAAKRHQRQLPLANRTRPLTLDDHVGQEHIIGPGWLLRRSIEADQLSSLIPYGPPGPGKTTLVSVIANTSSSEFVTLNAVLAGVKVLREEIEAAGHRFAYRQQRTTVRERGPPLEQGPTERPAAPHGKPLLRGHQAPRQPPLGWFHSDSSTSMRVINTQAHSGMFRSQVARHHPSGSPWIGKVVLKHRAYAIDLEE